jgi:hypothetical protein
VVDDLEMNETQQDYCCPDKRNARENLNSTGRLVMRMRMH